MMLPSVLKFMRCTPFTPIRVTEAYSSMHGRYYSYVQLDVVGHAVGVLCQDIVLRSLKEKQACLQEGHLNLVGKCTYTNIDSGSLSQIGRGYFLLQRSM